MPARPPNCTLFPYTTLFRSGPVGLQAGDYRLAGFEDADVVITIGYDLVEHAPKHWNPRRDKRAPRGRSRWRSEEHTSELQSQSKLVCRLLLEKKKKKTRIAI